MTSTSSETFKSMLEDVHLQISSVKCEVYEAIRAFYTQSSSRSIDEAISFSHAFTRSNTTETSIFQTLDTLETKLCDTVSSLQGTNEKSSHGKLITSLVEQQALDRRIQSDQDILSVLRTIVRIDDGFNEFENQMEKEDVMTAAILMQGIEQELGKLTAEHEHAELVHVMQSQAMKGRASLHYRIKELRDASIKIYDMKHGPMAHSVCVTKVLHTLDEQLLTEKVHLTDVWEAVEMAGMTGKIMSGIASEMKKAIFKPLLSRGLSQRLHSPKVESTDVAATLSWSTSAKDKGGNNLQKTCEYLLQVLTFVFEEVFNSKTQLMAHFGKASWSNHGGLATLLKEVLDEAVPSEFALLEQFKTVALKSASQLEERLNSIGYLPTGQDALTAHLKDLTQVFSRKKRKNLMASAHKILTSDYMNSVVVTDTAERTCLDATGSKSGKCKSGSTIGDSDTYFCLPPIHVSSCAQELVELAHQTLIEACTKDLKASCSNALADNARDILMMFSAVIPSLHKEDIQNDPRICMLFHNDCCYIAHHMLTIGHQYRSRLQFPMTMVDMVPSFRTLGESSLSCFVAKVKGELNDSLSHLPSLALLDSEELASDAETAVKEILYRLNRLVSTWKSGLKQSLYEEILGDICTGLVERSLNNILVQTAVPVTSAHQAYRMLSLFFGIEKMFNTVEACRKQVPLLSKFRQATELIDQSSLSSVSDKLQTGQLSELSTAEVASVVRAFYPDSAEKVSLINSIDGGY